MIENIRDGLNIFLKYNATSIDAIRGMIVVLGRHDLSTEDLTQLNNLGWFISQEFGCWAIFV